MARAAWRVGAAGAILLGTALVLPLCGLLATRRRQKVIRMAARALLAALGVRHAVVGRLPRRGALLVANHVSWLDVLVILAYAPARLLAKREMRRWPLIGVVAGVVGTLFIDRSAPRRLPATVATVSAALRAGALVAAFPEGTTWCGRGAGPFRPAMFQAAVDTGAPVAPMTLRFELADGSATTVAAFIGQDTLFASVRRVAGTRGLRVVARVHASLHPAPGASRRALARAAASAIGGAELGKVGCDCGVCHLAGPGSSLGSGTRTSAGVGVGVTLAG